MPRKDRSIPAKNANIRIEAAEQEVVERRILAALGQRECTKSDLYKKIGTVRANAAELERILMELADRKLISHRLPKGGETRSRMRYRIWGLYEHPNQVKPRQERERCLPEWSATVEKARKIQRRKEVKAEFAEFIADEAETFMRIADNLVGDCKIVCVKARPAADN